MVHCCRTLALAVVLLSVASNAFPLPYCGVDPASKNPPVLIPPLEVSDSSSLKLRQVQVVIRHGDRTIAQPANCWNNDLAVWDCTLTHASAPNNSPSQTSGVVGRLYRKVYNPNREDIAGNCTVGQLTSKGHFQQRVHGQQLRQAYVEGSVLPSQPPLLPSALNAQDVHLRSDDSPRTLLSAESLFSGLYPPATQGPTEFIDLHTIEETHSIMYGNGNLCPMSDVLYAKATQTAQYKEFMNASAPFIAKLKALLNSSATINQLPDCLWTHWCHSKPIPSGFNSTLMQQVSHIAGTINLMLDSYPDQRTAAKYHIGPLVYLINQQLQTMMSTGGGPKFFLWSGHDSTISPLLAAFGVLIDQWPPYASLVAVELYEDTANNTFSVRVVYNGKVQSVAGCPTDSQLCPMKSFAASLATVLPTPKDCPGFFKQYRRFV